MHQTQRARTARGFTLIEMLTAMFVLGVVLTLTVSEFTYAIANFRWTNAHLDAETQARVAMARINDLMKMGTPDILNSNCIKDELKCSVIEPAAPLQNSTDGNSSISFYEVTNSTADAGHLSPSMTVDASGNPLPTYDVVTVLYQPPDLIECTTTVAAFEANPSQPCLNVGVQTIAYDVTAFGITPLGCGAAGSCDSLVGSVQIDLQTTNNTSQAVASSTSGQTAESAYVSNTLYFSSWKGFGH
jgi:prepilin-type N-terminal cleavage/methylation domain-containing protein